MNDTLSSFAPPNAVAALLVGLAVTMPVCANARSSASDGSWHFAGTICGYLPKLGGSSGVPVDSAGMIGGTFRW